MRDDHLAASAAHRRSQALPLRPAPDYRDKFVAITEEMQKQCPLAWTDTYEGHWVAAGGEEVFELARCPHVSNDHDVNNERRGYKGISIPTMMQAENFRGGMLEMDDPEHRFYRTALNPYLSPAAVKRWVPFVDEIVRASIDEHIETGRIDFVDDLANVVPAVLTLAMLGVPLDKWTMYNEPAHASVYTAPDSPDAPRVLELYMAMGMDLFTNLAEIRENPRPGIIDALAKLRIDGEAPPDIELIGMLNLLIGGGFDTTTALTAHALEWLSHNPDQRDRLSRERATLLNPATEEFLRYFTPAPGDARTISDDMELGGTSLKEGDRLWLSWAMANRDPSLFANPNEIDMERKGNRHFSFGLGVHRCIGSNVARTVFKSMLTAVLDRMPDYECQAEGTVHYESIGVIQGMRHLPATFTPGRRLGPGLDETLAKLQRACDENGLARPITEQREAARLSD
ncbi:cytochrome P450 [Mycolicibacterium chitae]|uniref:cytochrome P450 n=1 Tax=Mycolicibacterium chitae TaxID=1792 RepID=UPI003F495A9B